MWRSGGWRWLFYPEIVLKDEVEGDFMQKHVAKKVHQFCSTSGHFYSEAPRWLSDKVYKDLLQDAGWWHQESENMYVDVEVEDIDARVAM